MITSVITRAFTQELDKTSVLSKEFKEKLTNIVIGIAEDAHMQGLQEQTTMGMSFQFRGTDSLLMAMRRFNETTGKSAKMIRVHPVDMYRYLYYESAFIMDDKIKALRDQSLTIYDMNVIKDNSIPEGTAYLSAVFEDRGLEWYGS